MNERIRELLEQAVMTVDNPFPGNPLNAELEKMYIPDCFAEKFAELIVADCIDTIRESTKSHLKVGATESELFEIHLRVEGALVAMAAVSKHFGVK